MSTIFTQTQFSVLAEQFIAASAEVEAAQAEYDRWAAANPFPHEAERYDRFEDYENYQLERRQWVQVSDAMGKDVNDARERRAGPEAELLNQLPVGVWFRFNDQGIGVKDASGYGDYEIIVAPWADEMPSLEAEAEDEGDEHNISPY